PVATFLNCVHSDWIQGACVQTEAPPAWSASSLLPRPVWLHLVFSAASIVGACNESAMSSIMNGRVSPKQAAVLLQEVFREACSAGLTYNGLTWYDSSVVMRTSCTTAVAPDHQRGMAHSTAKRVDGGGTTPQARSWSFHLTPA